MAVVKQSVEVGANRLAEVARLTSHGIMITDANGRIEWINEAFTRITGYTLEEVFGQIPGSFLGGPKTDLESSKRMGKAIRMRQAITAEIINYRKDGTEFVAHIEITPMWNSNREIDGFVDVATDTTEFVVINQERQLLRNLQEQTARLAGVGGWEVDIATEEVIWSDQVYAIHEVDRSYKPTLAEAISFYAPAARSKIASAVARCMKNGGGWDLELPFVTSSTEREHPAGVCWVFNIKLSKTYATSAF